MAKLKKEISAKDKLDSPLYPIGIVAELIGTTDQTLRLYEKHGLITPARRNKNRYYSENDVKWLRCIRELIHSKKISIKGIKKLMDYAPCWDILDCPEEKRGKCSAFIDKTKSCWELNRMICNMNGSRACEDCVVYLSRKLKKAEG